MKQISSKITTSLGEANSAIGMPHGDAGLGMPVNSPMPGAGATDRPSQPGATPCLTTLPDLQTGSLVGDLLLELEVLAGKYAVFGWERDRGTAVHDRICEDWITALSRFQIAEVREACRAWVRANPARMPHEGCIVDLIEAARRSAGGVVGEDALSQMAKVVRSDRHLNWLANTVKASQAREMLARDLVTEDQLRFQNIKF